MSFLYPLGLLGLIGIPILIIIYIIKSKYAEQTVASTYLWTLSERFLKRKKPISPLAGIISLILQILAVTAISFIIARPIITIPDSAKEYCFVLDSSGSMNMEKDGVTRFEKAKAEISDIINSATGGSRFSLIAVGDVTTTVFNKTTDKKQAHELLEELEGGFVEADYKNAITTAQKYFSENKSALTYLVTDTNYEKTENITIINVASDESNISLSDVTWKLVSGKLTVTGNIKAFGADKDVNVSLYVDGAEAPFAEADVSAKNSSVAHFELSGELKSFSSLRVTLVSDDSLECDDEYIIYNVKTEDTYSILLVSDRPFFLTSLFEAMGHTQIKVVDPDEYTASMGVGQGLYIFDCCAPTTLPSDGAVWFFDPTGSVPESGFSVQSEVTLARSEQIEKSTSSSSVAKNMLKNVKGDGVYIKEYVKCSLYRSFTTLFSYKGNPLVFAGTNAKGHREVVFAFDIHNSNLPLMVDYVILTENLMKFSFPDVVENANYFAGDDAAVNVIANCDSIRVETPAGEVSYLDTDQASALFRLAEVGTYTVTVTVSDVPREYYIYSSLPESERVPLPTSESIGLQGTAEDGGFDGTYDPLYVLFICLALLFLADWMVYCYEKYQLR